VGISKPSGSEVGGSLLSVKSRVSESMEATMAAKSDFVAPKWSLHFFKRASGEGGRTKTFNERDGGGDGGGLGDGDREKPES